MSCFIVEKVTIDEIMTYLRVYASVGGLSVLRPLRASYQLESIDQCEQLGLAMLNLNVDAYYDRYSRKSPKVGYEYAPVDVTKMQAYKSLRCFLYQCHEGSISEKSNLYKLLDGACNEIAHDIIYDTYEFKKAEWR